MKKNKHAFSLHQSMFFSALVLTMALVLILSIGTSSSMTDFLMKVSSQTDQQRLDQMQVKLDMAMNEMTRFMTNLSDHPILMGALEEVMLNNTTKRMYGLRDQHLAYLSNHHLINMDSIQQIQLHVGPYHFDLTTLSGVPADDELMATILKSNKGVIMQEIPINQGYQIRFFQPIIYRQSVVGYLLFIMDENWLEQIFAETPSVYLLSASGDMLIQREKIQSLPAEVIQSEEKQLVYEIDGYLHRFTQIRTQYNQWKLIVAERMEEIHQNADFSRNILICILLLIVLMGMLLSAGFARSISQKIGHIIRQVNEYRVGQLIDQNIKRYPSLRNMLLRYYCVMIAFVLAMHGVLFSIVLLPMARDVQEQHKVNIISQAANNIGNFAQINRRASEKIMYDAQTQIFLSDGILGQSAEDETLKLQVMQLCEQNIYLVGQYFDTLLYDREGNLIIGSAAAQGDALKMQQALQMDNSNCVWMRDRNQHYEDVLVLGRKIRYVFSGNSVPPLSLLGYVCFSYNTNVFGRLIGAQRDEICSLIDRKSGKAFYGVEVDLQAFPQDTLSVSGDQVIVQLPIDSEDWMLVQQIDRADFYAEINAIVSDYAVVLALCALIGLLAAFFFVNWLIHPITHILSDAAAFGHGNGRVDFIAPTRISEINNLQIAFAGMAERINENLEFEYYALMHQQELSNQRVRAELQALQAQINPHFLYNTLETIRWMVKAQKNNQASRMLSNLGKLFRQGISTPDAITTVASELECASLFLQIQKERFHDRLQVETVADPETLQRPALKMMLQPILENIFSHGIDPESNDPFSISIRSKPWGDGVCIEIADSGRGMSLEQLEELHAVLAGKHPARRIGIFNVYTRMKLHFSDRAVMEFENRAEGGFLVRMCIPGMQNE